MLFCVCSLLLFYDDNLYTNASVMLIDDDSHFAVDLILTILLTICWVDTVSMIILIFVDVLLCRSWIDWRGETDVVNSGMFEQCVFVHSLDDNSCASGSTWK